MQRKSASFFGLFLVIANATKIGLFLWALSCHCECNENRPLSLGSFLCGCFAQPARRPLSLGSCSCGCSTQPARRPLSLPDSSCSQFASSETESRINIKQQIAAGLSKLHSRLTVLGPITDGRCTSPRPYGMAATAAKAP
jgi:hypothetical protein